MPSLRLNLVDSIDDVPADGWDRLAAGASPFLSREFLSLLEDSGALAESGWRPVYALLTDGDALAACAPFYLAASSAGQFTWDDGMEDAARSLGKRWFPKLVGMVPFTPAPVWRVLGGPAPVLLSGMEHFACEGGLSGLHLQWTDPAFMPGDGWIPWRRQAYRWENRPWLDFDEYLGSFSKNMRRNVLRDRAAVAAAGIETRILRGDEADPSFWPLMERYYTRTNDKFGPWAARFLPPAFFRLARERLGPAALFSAAFRAGHDEPIALALLFQGGAGLWGRYWGSAEDLDGLHFETCYYRPIEYAIGRGLSFFDPGMGGHHKARRGFRAVMAASWHRVFDRRLSAMFASATAAASVEEAGFADELNAELPFKDDGAGLRTGFSVSAP